LTYSSLLEGTPQLLEIQATSFVFFTNIEVYVNTTIVKSRSILIYSIEVMLLFFIMI
jgi:hypothetical protein